MTTIANSKPAASSGTASSTFTDASPRQVQEWLGTGEAVLVDVREPDEYARERIAGARLLPLSRFDPRQAIALAAPGQKIVMQCRGGRRSADACRLAASLPQGSVTLVNMTGGIEAWKEDGLPVEVDTHVSRVSVMRQVQMVIGVCVLTGTALAWFAHPGFVVIPAFFGAGLLFAGATGTCAMAALIARLPWNRAPACGTAHRG